MKKLFAFFLVVSMLLTTMTPCVYAVATQCPVCERTHILQNAWRSCPEACNLQTSDPDHKNNPHRWYECPEMERLGVHEECIYCNIATNHNSNSCPYSNILWNESIGSLMDTEYVEPGINYRRPIYCTNCGYWGYHYENECNVTTSEDCDHSSTIATRINTWYSQNDKYTHIEYYEAAVICQLCGEQIRINSGYYSEEHLGDGVCECGYSLNSTHRCSYKLKHNNYYHWYECTCGNQKDFCEHSYASDGICRVCPAKCPHGDIKGEQIYYYEEYNSSRHYYVEIWDNYCETCGKLVSTDEDREKEGHYYIKGTGRCKFCRHECEHEDTRTKSYANEYFPYNETKHIFLLNQKAEICRDCGEVAKVYGREQLNDHYFQNGVCICGYREIYAEDETPEQGNNGNNQSKIAYLDEMKAGSLYAVSNDGHLYKRIYDTSESRGYKDQYVYTPKTAYDSFTLPMGELLIQKGSYLYDTDGNKVSANVSVMLACDQRIAKLKDIETAAINSYGVEITNSTQINDMVNGILDGIIDNIVNNVTHKISEYKQVKRGNKTLSSIAEQKVSYKAKTGSNNSIVTEIQQKLYDLGFTSQLVTGYYGSITFDNVAYFQAINGLEVTGWVDNTTYNKLDKPVAVMKKEYDADEDYEWIEPKKRTGWEYIVASGEQLALGNYTDEVTLLGTAAQIGTGIIGIDAPGDIRDITADVVNWKFTWSHVGQTGLDLVALIPIIGSLKYVDETAVVVKGTKKLSLLDEVSALAKNYKLSDSRYIDHIIVNHASTSTKVGRSKFLQNINIKYVIDDTLKSSSSLIKPNTADDFGNLRPGFIFEKTYPYQIGISDSGKTLNTMKVVINEGGEVVTAFPIK